MNLRQNVNLTELFARLRDSVRGSRLNLFEMIALVAALVFAGVVAFYYFTKVQPLNAQLEALQVRERAAQQQLDTIKTTTEKRQKQASNAEEILASLTNFEVYLKPDERGMTQIINEIEQLGKKHAVIAGDSSYRVEEAEPQLDENGQPVKKASGSEDKQNLYPALGIETNVIGEYPNLRRFLADLERSKQFLIINSLAFQGESDQVRRAAQKSGKQKLQLSSPEAVPVSLKIELDTYFRAPSKKETNIPVAEASEKAPEKSGKPMQKASAQ